MTNCAFISAKNGSTSFLSKFYLEIYTSSNFKFTRDAVGVGINHIVGIDAII